MAFQMNESPHKRGEIQGTESASALKVKQWFIKQITKNAPKVLDKIDDAWVATRDAIFGGGKKTSKYYKPDIDNKKVYWMSDRTAKGGKRTGYFGLRVDEKTGKLAFDPTARMSGSEGDIKQIDKTVDLLNESLNIKK